MVTSRNGKAFRTTDPFWGKSTVHWWISPHKGPVMRIIDFSFDISLNKILNNNFVFRRFTMPRCPCDVCDCDTHVLLSTIGTVSIQWIINILRHFPQYRSHSSPWTIYEISVVSVILHTCSFHCHARDTWHRFIRSNHRLYKSAHLCADN